VVVHVQKTILANSLSGYNISGQREEKKRCQAGKCPDQEPLGQFRRKASAARKDCPCTLRPTEAEEFGAQSRGEKALGILCTGILGGERILMPVLTLQLVHKDCQGVEVHHGGKD